MAETNPFRALLSGGRPRIAAESGSIMGFIDSLSGVPTAEEFNAARIVEEERVRREQEARKQAELEQEKQTLLELRADFADNVQKVGWEAAHKALLNDPRFFSLGDGTVESFAERLKIIRSAEPKPEKPLLVPPGTTVVSPTDIDPETNQLRELFRGQPAQRRFETTEESEIAKRAISRLNDVAEDGQSALVDEVAVGQLEQLVRKHGGITTGAMAAIRGYLGRVGVDLGDADDLQVFESLVDRLTPAQRQGLPGAASDRDVAMFKSALPQLIRQPEANRVIVGTMRALVDHRKAAGEIADSVFTGERTVPEALRDLRALPNPFRRFLKWAEENSAVIPRTLQQKEPEPEPRRFRFNADTMQIEPVR